MSIFRTCNFGGHRWSAEGSTLAHRTAHTWPRTQRSWRGRSHGSWRLCLGRWTSFSGSVDSEVITKGDTSCLWKVMAAVSLPRLFLAAHPHSEPQGKEFWEVLCNTQASQLVQEEMILTFPPALFGSFRNYSEYSLALVSWFSSCPSLLKYTEGNLECTSE